MLQNTKIPKGGGLLLAGIAAFAYYKYQKMSPEERTKLMSGLKEKGQKLYDQYMPAVSTNNATLGITEVLEQYKQLYKIEHSFRTFKSHLETRPMFHWTDSRIEGHICLCYIAFALQNYVLQKANKTKPLFTETSLRKTLDKMQVSLVKHNAEQAYIRSAPTANEAYLQQQMGVKSLLPIIRQSKIII